MISVTACFAPPSVLIAFASLFEDFAALISFVNFAAVAGILATATPNDTTPAEHDAIVPTHHCQLVKLGVTELRGIRHITDNGLNSIGDPVGFGLRGDLLGDQSTVNDLRLVVRID